MSDLSPECEPKRTLPWPTDLQAYTLIGVDPKPQHLCAGERHEIALPLPCRRLAQRRHQFIVGLRTRRRTGTLLQRARDEDHGIARHRKLTLAALAPEFEGGFAGIA